MFPKACNPSLTLDFNRCTHPCVSNFKWASSLFMKKEEKKKGASFKNFEGQDPTKESWRDENSLHDPFQSSLMFWRSISPTWYSLHPFKVKVLIHFIFLFHIHFTSPKVFPHGVTICLFPWKIWMVVKYSLIHLLERMNNCFFNKMDRKYGQEWNCIYSPKKKKKS